MRDSITGLRQLFAKVPTPYTGRYDGAVAGGLLGGFGGRSKAEELGAYASNGTLFAIVSNLALGTSNAEWHLYRKRTDQRRRLGPAPDERTEILVHQALEVWRRPNPFMWQQTFVERVQQHLDLTGVGAFAVERPYDGAPPQHLWPVRPDRITVTPDREDFIAGYTYTAPDGEAVPLGVDELVMLQMPDPLDVYGGVGPAAAVHTDVESARAAAEWNRNFFRNSALPGGLIEVDKTLSDKEFDSMVKRWRESHKGVNNAHRVGILEQAKWKDRQVSQKDMEFVSLRNMSRDVIREAYAYPEFLLGDMGDANRASAYAAEFVEARRLLEPRLKRWRGALNYVFLPMFGPATDLEFDFDSPEPDDEESFASITSVKAAAFSVLVAAGVDPDDAAEVVGLPPMRFEKPAPPPPQLVPGPPAEVDDPEAPAEPTGDPVDPEAEKQQVAARAHEILRSNGLAAAILNGHAREARR